MNGFGFIFALGTLEYLFDIALSGDLYKDCWTFETQSSIWFHHVAYIFGLFGWIASNSYSEWLYFFSIPGYFSHWKVNKLKCGWGIKDSKKCNKDFKLRTFGRLAGLEDKNRRVQIAWFALGWCIVAVKLFMKLAEKRF